MTKITYLKRRIATLKKRQDKLNLYHKMAEMSLNRIEYEDICERIKRTPFGFDKQLKWEIILSKSRTLDKKYKVLTQEFEEIRPIHEATETLISECENKLESLGYIDPAKVWAQQVFAQMEKN